MRLLVSFQSTFPLRRSSDLTSPASRRVLLDRTHGVTVRIVRFLDGHMLLSRSLAPPLCDQGRHADTSIVLLRMSPSS
jgi:hypothetical protein